MKSEHPPQFGLCMDGNESAFTRLLSESVATCPPWESFLYVEIGVAEGQTLAAACRIITESNPPGAWRAIGIDIPDGWSLNKAAIAANNPNITEISNPSDSPAGRPSLILESSQQCLSWHVWHPIHFAFIDGCHGRPCAMGDFLALEPLMAPGGIIAFHDASEKCQGHHMQPHCGTGINVRAALQALRLLPPATRRGWIFLEEPPADHACAFFKKIHPTTR